jgi:hypothetical protein
MHFYLVEEVGNNFAYEGYFMQATMTQLAQSQELGLEHTTDLKECLITITNNYKM